MIELIDFTMPKDGSTTSDFPRAYSDKIVQRCSELTGAEIQDGVLRVSIESRSKSAILVLEFLDLEGVKVIDYLGLRRGEEGLFIQRTMAISKDDLLEASLVQMMPKKIKIKGSFRDLGPGNGSVAASKINKSVELGLIQGCLDRIFCSATGRAKILEAELKGVSFVKIAVKGKASADHEVWELIPKESIGPVMNHYVVEGNVTTSIYPKSGMCRLDSPYPMPLHEYDKEKVASLNVDLVRSEETFGWAEMCRFPALFFSQDFKKLCDQHKWARDWLPIIEL